MQRIFKKAAQHGRCGRAKATVTLQFYGHLNTLFIRVYPLGYWHNMALYKDLKVNFDSYNYGTGYNTYAQGCSIEDRVAYALNWFDQNISA